MTTQTIAQLFDLSGKGAIVTGGAMGIGKAISLRLAEAGAAVTIADIDLDAAAKTVEQITSQNGKAQAILADARSADDAAKAVETTVEAFGSLDILVNNVGIFPISPVLEINGEAWDRVLDINLKSTLFYSQAAARQMIDAGRGGKIVNMASMEGLHPRADFAHYTTSKAGVIMLTRSLALELAAHNILVNAIAPGGVWTPGAKGLAIETEKQGISLKENMEGFLARLPIGRFAMPDDVAKVALFLVSGAADYVTGSVIVVDGGYLQS